MIQYQVKAAMVLTPVHICTFKDEAAANHFARLFSKSEEFRVHGWAEVWMTATNMEESQRIRVYKDGRVVQAGWIMQPIKPIQPIPVKPEPSKSEQDLRRILRDDAKRGHLSRMFQPR
jgi:hypothetical protein